MTKAICKVSGISSLTDARYCAGMEVDYLGIPFDNQVIGAIDRNLFVSISGWIEGPVWVGEYEGNDFQNILEISDSYGINFWQLSNKDLALKLRILGFKVALKVEDLQENQLKEVLETIRPEFLVLKANPNSAEDVKRAKALNERIQVLIHPISGIADVEFWKSSSPGIGFQLVSGEEERPGWMDLSGLQDILENLEVDNA